MNKYNVFNKTLPHRSWLYWENLRHIPYQLKKAKQRATRGFATSDWFNMDSWFGSVIPEMLEEFSEKCYAHPAEMTPEEWKDILNEMAFRLRNATDENVIDKKFSHMANSLAKDREQDKWRREELHKFLELFEEHFYSLWD